jgi:hypothetical protein
MRQIAFVFSVWLLCIEAPMLSQERGSSGSVERLVAILQQRSTQPDLPNQIWMPPDRRQLGILRLVPVTGPGEIVRLSLPIGELVTSTARAVNHSKRRRAEQKAREDVQRALRDFLAQTP